MAPYRGALLYGAPSHIQNSPQNVAGTHTHSLTDYICPPAKLLVAAVIAAPTAQLLLVAADTAAPTAIAHPEISFFPPSVGSWRQWHTASPEALYPWCLEKGGFTSKCPFFDQLRKYYFNTSIVMQTEGTAVVQ